ncbi:Eukaryotic translation initiation factor 3 subunit E [Porphyridium purpureum]|uniref:Eukaryotic translation initiation factor 3 subunit E n=1 Tax=Porphyridium purpureum TaxID=35688 RepID=A0A5J4YSB6_PORPP|nr:Eukaryotic translation initiation factor 3 subunit E [Porphyridium purpureum]|eukprot:POR9714..scf236_6
MAVPGMATSQNDLTPVLAQYLDRHLVFPLVEFMEGHPSMEGQFDVKDLLRAKLDLLEKTNMVDFAMDIYKQLHDGAEPPQEMLKHRGKVLVVLQTLQEECEPLFRVMGDDALVQELRDSNQFNMETLGERYGITRDVLESLYDYAKFQFDVGDYLSAADYLSVYRILSNGVNPEREFYALWGKLAASILNGEWDLALEDIAAIREVIDGQAGTRPSSDLALNPLQILQQRTWLIHWSLFVFFGHPEGPSQMIDMFLSDAYLNTIQTNCPHILRYLTAVVIVNKGRRGILKDLIRVVKEELHNYQDPITQFVECLYVNFDFEGAQDTLKRCEETLKHDYFLVGVVDEFVENARLTIFETYCRIHQCIDIDMLASKLNMDRESAERWVVNLVRNAKLDAKIDSEKNQVLMRMSTPSVYEQVTDLTKNLTLRTNGLVNGYDRRDGGYGDNQRGGKQWRGGSRRAGAAVAAAVVAVEEAGATTASTASGRARTRWQEQFPTYSSVQYIPRS